MAASRCDGMLSSVMSNAQPGWSWAGPTSAFLNPESPFAADRLTDAAVVVLRTGGVERLTLGAVAREMGVSAQAAHQLAGSRAEFLEQIVRTFLDRWWRWYVDPRASGIPVRMPTDDDEIEGLRVFRSLAELSAGEHRAGRSGIAALFAAHRHRQRDRIQYLARRRNMPIADDELDHLEALMDGLAIALLRPEDPITPQRAARLLREHLAARGWSGLD